MTNTRVYDKAKWHYEGKRYPKGLAEIHAYTHGGFLLAWLFRNKLLAKSFLRDHHDSIKRYESGEITPGKLNDLIDGVLDSDMLTKRGNDFAEDYIDESYLEDYTFLFEYDFKNFYSVADDEKCFEMACEMLDTEFANWKKECAED